tara:strand:- start:115 stop:2268 length:2154 start_codon:yes stop_codon:yes gene_type:complete
MSYTERFQPEAVNNLLKCNEKHLHDMIWDEETEDDIPFGFKDRHDYICQLINWLHRVKQNNYMNVAGYSQLERGRQYVKEFGIQKLKKNVRGYLVENSYDYDMCNCHPVLLKYIAERDCEGADTTYLDSYIKDRESILSKHNITKLDVIKCINKDNYTGKNKWLRNFNNEIKIIQEVVSRKSLFTTKKVYNKKASILNKELCQEENRILEYCIKNIKADVAALMFDGFMCNKKNLTNKLNDLTKTWGITWKIKDAEPLTFIEPLASLNQDKNCYEEMKFEFEKTHFIIKKPLCYCVVDTVNGEETIYRYTKSDLCGVYEPVKYKEVVWNNKNKDFDTKMIPFIPTWLADDTRREYERFGFIPPPLVCPEKTYNLFNGFIYETYDVVPDDNISVFLDHIRLLAGDEKTDEIYEYILNYLAHLIQKPAELPKTSILLKSIEGMGKDILFGNFGKYVLGKQYTVNTAKADDIVGKFNMLNKKFLVIWNETSGRDTCKELEQIKSMITEETITWEEKGKQKITLLNTIRLFFFTNNSNAMKPGPTDRRLMVVECSNNLPPKNYFDALGAAFNNKAQILGFVNYLKKIDLSNWSAPVNRVLTGFHEELSAKSVPHFDKFIIDRLYKMERFNSPEETRATPFYREYETWCFKKGYTPNTTTAFGRQLPRIDGVSKRNVKGGVMYSLVYDEIVAFLWEHKYIDDDFKLELLGEDDEVELETDAQ